MLSRHIVVFTSAMVAAVQAATLRETDELVVSSGPGNIPWIQSALASLAPLGRPITVQTKGLANVAALWKDETIGVYPISYDYEPDPLIPEFSWNALQTFNNMVAAGDDGAVTSSPTGRPLLESDLLQYHWDYSAIAVTGVPSLIQTQTWVRQNRFGEALDKLIGQYLDPTLFIPEISIANDTNGVPVATGAAAAQTALDKGCPAIFLWWNLPAQLTAFLAAT